MQNGGLLPIKKEASMEVDWSAEESEKLLKQIAVPGNQPPSMVRDGIDHTIEIAGKETPVNVDKASGKFAKVLKELKHNLKIVKT